MSKIILASGSAQRKKLLKLLGISFVVCKSRVHEEKKIKTTCSALVKHNAFIKAQDVAKKFKDGVIIGSDTVVYIGEKKLLLKPKDMKDAKRILKVQMHRPQWVYSGVALINARTGRALIDYEKTKVFMTLLSDKEITAYHKRVSPLDKAGGFDIEGLGSVFIHRIEGCYTNVIGLPMAKLYQMLKKMGVQALSLVIAFILAGCASEFNLATQKQESLIYGTEKEVELGDKVAKKIEEEYKLVDNVEMNEQAQRILDKIVAVCDRKDIIYTVKILDEDIMNAISLPGGHIFLFRGLMEKVKNDDQLAGVIAHEVGHITARHGVKRLQASYSALALQVAAAQAEPGIAGGVGLALTSLFMEYAQQAEFESDRLGVKYMKAAGYDPNQMHAFLEGMYADFEKQPLREHSYWKTHPNLKARMAAVNQEIKGKLEFKDYLNLTGTEYK